MKRVKSYSSPYLLYLIATPIGNLKEMNPRAIETLSDCDVIMCEDTRVSGKLLGFFNIKGKELLSLREHNESSMADLAITLIKQGKKVVYMSDAGYPTISDPGEILVNKCIANDIAVSTINGSSAMLSALLGANLSKDKFLFYGFLDAKKVAREKQLKELENELYTIVFYEAPHRIEATLHSIYDVLGDRKVTLCRELTKINEEYIYGTVGELLELDFTTIIGEIVIVLEGKEKNKEVLSDIEIEHLCREYLAKGLTKKDAIEAICKENHLAKNQVYNIIKNLD
ncbi:MAG: 16S rRNA (cytidine(1402)-2'-O)-methyltransferase [Coprobacillus sp.]|nr:16S rRNA (cytidine(1402)-2'-O)-methyltransferase [Coprobacillus sp.]